MKDKIGTRKKINNVHYTRKTAKWCTTQQTKKEDKKSVQRGNLNRMEAIELNYIISL